MRFDIRLGYNIQTMFITKFIEIPVIRIMARAYSVDIVFLHQSDVLKHSLSRYLVTMVRIDVMTIDSFDEDRLAIDEQLSSFNLHFAETCLERNGLDKSS